VSLINYKSKFPEDEMNNITSFVALKVHNKEVCFLSRSSIDEDLSVLGTDAMSIGK
jgi:hypothetical protein